MMARVSEGFKGLSTDKLGRRLFTTPTAPKYPSSRRDRIFSQNLADGVELLKHY